MNTLASSLHSDLRELFKQSVAVNTTAFEGEENDKAAFIGSETETALLDWAQKNLGSGMLNVEHEKTLSKKPSHSSQEHEHKWRRQWEIPGSIGGIRAVAFPDSGSSRDFLSQEFVQKYLPTHPIDSGSISNIKMPNGKLIRSLGELQVSWRFEGESTAYTRSFAVLPSCVHDVVLGKTFLRLSKTLPNFRNRLREKLVSCSGARRVHLIGSSEQVLGRLDGYLTSACPDTGSDIMAVSLSFAEKRRYRVDRSQENKIQVQFADGSIGWTLGKVFSANWNFGHGEGVDSTFKVDFYVLAELPCDVVLSNEFLFDNDVFNQFEEYFVRGIEDEEEGFDGFYMIQRVGYSLLAKTKKFFKRDPPLGKPFFPYIL
jgi:hypothetical protein